MTIDYTLKKILNNIKLQTKMKNVIILIPSFNT